MSSESKKEKYGIGFPADSNDLEIEFFMIQRGEAWLKEFGFSLFNHYKKAQQLLWPEEDDHRWSDLILKEILKNDITVLMGAKDSGKTHGMAKFGLTDYFAFPDNTLIIVSSTDLRSLEGRVWGDIKGMWRRAKQRWPWLPGSVLDSKHAICTDNLDDESVIVRDMRRGILCVPTRNSSGGITNISAYVGMKQERKRYLADEFQFMTQAMYDSLANANSGNFKMVCAGNPIGQGDPLDVIAEPKGGWESMPEPDKTVVWDNEKFLRSRTINLVGTDSPNFDYPQTEYTKFWYLTNKDSIARTVAGYGLDSHQYYSQCKGVRKSGLNARRVITKEMCRQFHAFDSCIWHGSAMTKIFALDAAYGGIGGDRCVGGHIEFGVCDDGKIRLSVIQPKLVIISLKKTESPEDQIAAWVMDYCKEQDIPPENCYFDSTGRGSLGTAFARLWSAKVNPVEFGGSPTTRPVSLDFYIIDDKTKERRLKRCDEHYRKFVTELWWTTRLAIESDQVRNLPEDVCAEGCMREWKEVAGNRIEIETKEEMKLRMGRSPDLYDWCFDGQTLIETPRGKTPISKMKPGDKVITPFGVTGIQALRVRKIDVITTVEFSDGTILSGAGQHKVFSWDSGWKRMDSLSIDNDIESIHNLPIWKLLNVLFTKDESSTFKALVDTIRTATTARLHARDFFIESFGLSIMGLFRVACVSIIRMMIGKITESPIWNWFQRKTTRGITSIKDWPIRLKRLIGPERTSSLCCRLLNGIIPKLAGNGTPTMPDMSGKTYGSQESSIVRFAEKNSRLYASRRRDSVRADAWQDRRESGIRILKEFVWCVALNFLRTDTALRRIVPITVRQSLQLKSKKVYNLTLDEHNVYYANGILVQNCATAFEGARRKGFQITKLATDSATNKEDWLQKEAEEYAKFQRERRLQHA